MYYRYWRFVVELQNVTGTSDRGSFSELSLYAVDTSSNSYNTNPLSSQVFYENFEDQDLSGSQTRISIRNEGYLSNYALKGDSTQDIYIGGKL